jgi:hypothetical protein
MVKIGYSQNINKRIKSLKTASPFPLLLLGYMEGDKQREKEIQNMFIKYCSQLEWFNVCKEILDFVNLNTLTNTYCDFDNKGILRVYKKMDNF